MHGATTCASAGQISCASWRILRVICPDIAAAALAIGILHRTWRPHLSSVRCTGACRIAQRYRGQGWHTFTVLQAGGGHGISAGPQQVAKEQPAAAVPRQHQYRGGHRLPIRLIQSIAASSSFRRMHQDSLESRRWDCAC